MSFPPRISSAGERRRGHHPPGTVVRPGSLRDAGRPSHQDLRDERGNVVSRGHQDAQIRLRELLDGHRVPAVQRCRPVYVGALRPGRLVLPHARPGEFRQRGGVYVVYLGSGRVAGARLLRDVT